TRTRPTGVRNRPSASAPSSFSPALVAPPPHLIAPPSPHAHQFTLHGGKRDRPPIGDLLVGVPLEPVPRHLPQFLVPQKIEQPVTLLHGGHHLLRGRLGRGQIAEERYRLLVRPRAQVRGGDDLPRTALRRPLPAAGADRLARRKDGQELPQVAAVVELPEA